MAVRGVLAQADIGDGHQRLRGLGRFDGAEAALDDAVGRIRAAALLVLVVRNPKQQHSADAERGALFDFFQRLVDGQVEDAGHGADLAAYAFPLAEKQRIDQRAGMQVGLTHQRAHGGRGAQAAQACGGKLHADDSTREGLV